MSTLKLVDDDVLIVEDLAIYQALKIGQLSTLGQLASVNILRRLNIEDIGYDVTRVLEIYQSAWDQKLTESQTRQLIKNSLNEEFTFEGPDVIKRNGAFYINIGRRGFNSKTNNRAGYKSRQIAMDVISGKRKG